MNMFDLLAKLHQQHIKVTAEDGQLKLDAPKGAMTPELLQQIKDHKADILAYLQSSSQQDNRIEVVDRGVPLPLSFAQQRLWLVDQMEGGSSHYNVCSAFEVDGGFDVALARQAFQSIIDRHETLRTVFVADEQHGALQVIREDYEFELLTLDFSGSARADSHELITEKVLAEAAYQFDLQHDLMLRIRYLQFAGQQGVLLFNIHHIASDAWSLGVLVNEFAECYRALAGATAPQLPVLAIQYADYAVWQRQWLSGERLQQQLDYWKTQLVDLPQVHSLPLDFPRPAQQTYRGVSHIEPVADEVYQQLTQLARSHKATLFMVLHAAFSVLLARHGHSSDVVIGTPVANRLQKSLEHLIGFFVNNLVLRVDCTDNCSFTELLARVKDINLKAQSHQDVQFDQVVEQQKPERSNQYTPLFQIMLSMNNNDSFELTLPDCRLAALHPDEIETRYELILYAVEEHNRLSFNWVYNKALFKADTIHRLAGHLNRLLSDIGRHPETPIYQLAMLNDAEQQQLQDFSQGSVPQALIHEAEPISVLTQFEQQAAATPEACAAVCGEMRLSYGELNQQANQLARRMQLQGVKAGDRVGLYLPRSIRLPVAILAVFKLGAAYVALEPSYPRARLHYMLADSGATLVLSQTSLPYTDERPQQIPVLAVDDHASGAALSGDNLPAVDPGALAYVVYTSGTTGQPKGVAVSQTNLAAYVSALLSVYPVPQGLRYGLLSTVATDLGNTALYTCLMHGGELHLIDDDTATDAQAFMAYLRQQQLAFLKLTPNHFNALFATEEIDATLPLQWLFVGGEASHGETVSKLRRLAGSGCRVVNHYGPSETTVGATTYALTADQQDAVVPIGRPLPHACTWVLDHHRQPVPQGCIGELYIGGDGVAQGYLNQPELTAQRFVDNPLGDGKLYRTGDLVRYLPTGELEFIGRVDAQVKIRGYRIELGEIEQQLAAIDGVRAAVAVILEDDSGAKKIAAYVVMNGEPAGDVEVMREALAQMLPDYMIPATFTFLPQLPLTANGKVDRKALPDPDEHATGTQYVAAQNEIEQQLVDIWARVLKADTATLSTTANFFESGGDSILSILMISQAVKAGLVLSPKLLINYQTIQTLAPHVKRKNAPQVQPATDNASKGEQPLLPVQHRFFECEIEPHHYNQSVLITTPAGFSLEQLRHVVSWLVRKHDVLRLGFERRQQGWHGHYVPVSEETMQATVRHIRVPSLATDALSNTLDEIQQSLVLDSAPLIRFVWLTTADNAAGRLLIVAHHLVVDGVSWRILLADMELLMQQADNHEALQRWQAQKTTSYQQWAQQLQRYAGSPRAADRRARWQRILQADAPLSLATRDDAGHGHHGEAGEHRFTLSPELTVLLLKQVPRRYRSNIHEVLLTALYLGLSQWADVDTLRIDLEGHGRETGLADLGEDLDLSQTVGWFTSVYPMLLSADRYDLAAALSAVKDQLRLIDHGGLEFGIFKYLLRDEAFVRCPASPVIFNYLGQFDQSLADDSAFALTTESSGCEISPRRPLAYELNISAVIVEQTLQFSILFDRQRFTDASVAQLNSAVESALHSLIDHCLSIPEGTCSAADFPLAHQAEPGLQQVQLNALRTAGYQLLPQSPESARESDSGTGINTVVDIYPVTAMQRGLLFHSAVEGGAYVSQLVMTLKGDLNLEYFRRAWQSVVSRHAIFRTFFIGLDAAAAFQVVTQAAQLPFQQEDLSQLPADKQQAVLERLVAEDKQHGFDLQQAPLMRVNVWKLGPQHFQVLWSRHHALSDGWSSQQVFEEVTATYQSLLQQQSLQLPEPPPYRNYIAWLQQQNVTAARDFWRRYLQPVNAPTRIGVAGVAVNGDETGLGREILQLDAALSEAMATLARQSRTTVSTVVQAAWAYLLYRYSGENRVTFGETVSGRPADLDGVETMVGLFINSLPVSVELLPQSTVQNWLQALHQASIERSEHGFVPLADIQQLSSLSNHSELFSSLIVFESYPGEQGGDDMADNGSGLQLESVYTDEYTHYDLTLCVEPGAAIEFRLEYQRHRYAPVIIQQMLTHLQRILHQLVAAPDARIADIELLSADEQRLQLQQWNSPQVQYAGAATIHERFQALAAQYPQRLAAVHNDDSISYGELDQYANRLAGYLRAQGIGKGSLVAIYAYRSVHFLAAILATMKAGGAYVPLDPVNPPERIRYMLEDSASAVVITQSALLERIDNADAINIFCLDRDQSRLSTCSDETPVVEVGADDPAYMIYTSGSTGRPKGALVHHAGALNHIDAEFDVLNFMSADRQLLPKNFLLSAASSSDVSVWQFLAPVISGGHTVVLDDMTDFAGLMQMLQQHRVHLIQCAPVLLQLLVEYVADLPPAQRELPDLQWMMCIAEAAPVKLVNRWLSLYPDIPIMNGYGPSEASDDITYYIVDKPLPDSERNILIGKPLPNLTAYIVDPQLRLQPLGVPGELCISGVGVGPGYWRNPEKTGSSFVSNPFCADGNPYQVHGDRIYRTGDLARWLPDGNLEFMGRLDNQTKVRGFRIELGEVEAHLARLSGIGEVAVLVRKDSQGNNTLAAYIVCRSQPPLTVQHIRDQLSQSLPDYMIPATFTFMDRMPLTPADKIDRAALPEPTVELREDFIAPAGEKEIKLAKIWQELLGMAQVSSNDNFFACGGDSILTIQLVSRAQRVGVNITPRQVLESTSLAALAAAGSDERRIDAPQYPITGQQLWLPVQRRWLAGDQTDMQHYNQSFLLRPPAGFEVGHLQQILTALYKKHDVLRLSIQPAAGVYCPFQSTLIHDAIGQESIAGLAATDKETRLRQICEHVQTTLSWADNRLLRAVLIDADRDEERRLLLVIHHMIVDGVSWRIIKADFEQAWQQLQAGQSIDLGPKTSSFQQWAGALYRYAETGISQTEREYWEAQQNTRVTPLPIDQQSDDNTMAAAAELRFELDREVSAELEGQCHQAYRTRSDHLIMAAIVRALNLWFGLSRIKVELEGHGRFDQLDQLDVSETVGWFTSQYPLVFDTRNDCNVAELITSVKETLNAVPNDGIAYGLLFGDQPVDDVQISYNNLGKVDTTAAAGEAFGIATEAYDNDVSPRRQREYPLSFSVKTEAGILSLTIHYNRHEYRVDTIDVLGAQIIRTLTGLVGHCRSRQSRYFTPSDFPLLPVTQEQLRTWQQSYPQLRKLYPATAMQRGMLFHSALDASAYCSQLDLRLNGPLETEAFRQAWRAVIRRHDIFRTAFVGSEHHQLVVQDAEMPWTEQDWRQLSSAQQDQQFAAYQQADKARGFDETQIPLMRMSLFRLEDNVYRLLWSNHHVLMDGWSLPTVFAQVMEYYQAGLSDPESTVSLVPQAQYEDYIGWLQRQDKNAAEGFWRSYLASLETPTHLSLPAATTISDESSGECRLDLPAALTAQLQQRARQHRTTLNILMQAAWSYLLHCYSGEDLVLFGETVAGRPGDLNGVEDIVGLFINSLPVKVDFSSDMTIADWLQALHHDSSSRSDHGFLSLPEIQNLSPLGNGVSLFETLLVFENFPVASQLQDQSILTVSDVLADEQTNFDLTLVIYAGDTLALNLRYQPQTHDHTAVQTLLRHFAGILESLADPQRLKLSELTMLDPEETRWLLDPALRPAAHRPADSEQRLGDVARRAAEQPLQSLFEQQVERTPAAIAVVCEGESLSYQALNERANQLAAELRTHALPPDALVGICLERSVDMVVAILAVLKAGAAYVPLDPHYPRERLDYIVSDSGMTLLLTETRLTERFSEQSSLTLICSDQDEVQQRLRQHPAGNPESLPGAGSHDLAYIIYTSGSTGQPKGVMVEHGNVHRLMQVAQLDFEFNADDVWTLFHSFAFDFSVWEIWGALSSGARLVVVPKTVAQSTEEFYQLLAREQVTVLNQTPTAFEQLCRMDELRPQPLALRYVIFGGEALKLESLRSWIGRHGDSQPALINMYGITETTVHVTWRRITAADIRNGRGSPIGYPLADLRVYILDAHQRPVPVGCVGEIYVAGAGVTRGYLHRPELTAERFVNSPFAAGETLYRTGDLGRWLASGEIDYVGRIDHQVKIRGFRIEPGEIEQHIMALDCVNSALVTVHNQASLVAYLTPAQSHRAEPAQQPELIAEVRAALRQSLPEHMQPTFYVVIAAFPLTAHGKIDTRALPQPDIGGLQQSYRQPAEGCEQTLAELWAGLLDIDADKISADAHFFELGGHSLLLIKAAAAIRDVFAVVLSLREILENPRLNELAAVIYQHRLTQQITMDNDDALQADEVETVI
ncbi:non-ribosomal peptide synthetase [Gynuella sunshinyii]|uniref:Non-ribosomal peptide synthetase modules-related protein n=1 Tax=Gynuella sunshinyii YC6258 TaxID=1445510 RepID=A0A0C5VUT5_9GAMM|nr:non-ribosomal peptide synthetase [Gynuella sunshinyii]AJQ94154.1 non-ribosomal peptide synthetase modules-related protein [Gynuella sunshinyii YC6258]